MDVLKNAGTIVLADDDPDRGTNDRGADDA
jgi:hypothetical protein